MKLAINSFTKRTIQKLIRSNLADFKNPQGFYGSIGHTPSPCKQNFNIRKPYPVYFFQQFFFIAALPGRLQIEKVVTDSITSHSVISAYNACIAPKPNNS